MTPDLHRCDDHENASRHDLKMIALALRFVHIAITLVRGSLLSFLSTLVLASLLDVPGIVLMIGYGVGATGLFLGGIFVLIAHLLRRRVRW